MSLSLGVSLSVKWQSQQACYIDMTVWSVNISEAQTPVFSRSLLALLLLSRAPWHQPDEVIASGVCFGKGGSNKKRAALRGREVACWCQEGIALWWSLSPSPSSPWKCTAGTAPWWRAPGSCCAAGKVPRLTRQNVSSAWTTLPRVATGATWATAPACGSSRIPASSGSCATATTCSTSARAPCSSSGAPAATCVATARARSTTTCSCWARCCPGWRPSWSRATRCCSSTSSSSVRRAKTGAAAGAARGPGEEPVSLAGPTRYLI